jgi:hypothetical protein
MQDLLEEINVKTLEAGGVLSAQQQETFVHSSLRPRPSAHLPIMNEKRDNAGGKIETTKPTRTPARL